MVLRCKLIHTNNTTKNNNISRFGWLLCCFCCPPPPPPAAFVRYCHYRCVRLVVVSSFHQQRPRWFTIIVLFFAFLPLDSGWLLYCFNPSPPPHTPPRIPIDCCVVFVGWCGLLWPLSFPTEVKCVFFTSFIHLSMASAVIVTVVAAESMLLTPPPVAQTLVMVLVGFGMVGAAIWRLPAMVGSRDGRCVVRWG